MCTALVQGSTSECKLTVVPRLLSGCSLASPVPRAALKLPDQSRPCSSSFNRGSHATMVRLRPPDHFAANLHERLHNLRSHPPTLWIGVAKQTLAICILCILAFSNRRVPAVPPAFAPDSRAHASCLIPQVRQPPRIPFCSWRLFPCCCRRLPRSDHWKVLSGDHPRLSWTRDWRTRLCHPRRTWCVSLRPCSMRKYLADNVLQLIRRPDKASFLPPGFISRHSYASAVPSTSLSTSYVSCQLFSF